MEQWKTIIKPKGKVFDLQLGEVWKYRDLIGLFVKREFISKYKQTILGPLWAVIQPLLTTVVFSIIFGVLANLTTADVMNPKMIIPGFLFYMMGTIIWTYFSSTVTSVSNTFIGNMHIMGKVYYPRMVTPISSALANLIPCFIQLALFAVIYAITIFTGVSSVGISWMLVMLPVSLLEIVILSIGVGIIISALTTKYRDLIMLVTFGLQLWQYASPITYGITLIPEKWLWLYNLNPITPIITSIRYACFGEGYFNWMYYLIGWGITLSCFFIGLLLFNRIEKNFMDTI